MGIHQEIEAFIEKHQLFCQNDLHDQYIYFKDVYPDLLL
jgi:hypothetical protein